MLKLINWCKVILFCTFITLIPSMSWATTWYVRDGGGTAAQCTGKTNAVYPGSGTNQNCAVNHPAWIFGTPNTIGEWSQPPLGTPALAVGGDTIYIDGDSDITPGSQAQYMIGYGMPNTSSSQCAIAYGTGACTMAVIPAGTSSSTPTRILGTGTHNPQLWGTQNLGWVLDLTGGGNYDIENLELTQHSSCSYVSPSGYCPTSYPYGNFAQSAIYMEGANITTYNLWVHNFSRQLIYFPGQVSNWNDENSRWVAAGQFLDNGLDGSQGGDAYNMSFAGNNSMTNDVWAFGGCTEKYPLPDPSNLKDLNNYNNCCDTNLCGGAALGGGFANQAAQSTCGNWNISYSQFLFNLKSNFDFLHCDGTGTYNLYRSRSEGPTGEALKLNVGNVNIEESQLIADDGVWLNSNFQSILSAPCSSGCPGSIQLCRGGAVTNFGAVPNEQVNILNSDVEGNCSSLLLTSTTGCPSCTCTGMSINSRNNKYLAGYDYFGNRGQQVDLLYNAGSDGNGGGACGTGAVPLNMNYDIVYQENDPSDCSGAHSQCGVDPKIIGESSTSYANLFGPTAYLNTTSLGDQFYLQPTSPAIGAGISGLTYTNGSPNDYNNHIPNSQMTIGALQNNTCIISSTSPTSGFCSISNQCCGASCSASGYCSGSCTSNGGSCSVGGTCCSNLCSGSVCVACLANGNICSTNANCCSGDCASGTCTSPAVKGNFSVGITGSTKITGMCKY